MFPEVVIFCDEVRFLVKNGELHTITVGNDEVIDFREFAEYEHYTYDNSSYEDVRWAFEEKCKLQDRFMAAIMNLKCYNCDAGTYNPVLNSLFTFLTEEEAAKVKQHIYKAFYEP